MSVASSTGPIANGPAIAPMLSNRVCRICGEEKNLIEGFYRTHKDRGPVASSYSYECKVCTIQRIVRTRRKDNPFSEWNYPDW